MLREFALGGAHPLAGRPSASIRAADGRGACTDLEQTQLLGRQRRLGVRVILTSGKQAPEQHRELARASHDGDLGAPSGADAFIEGVQRARLLNDRPSRLDQRPTRLRRALL